MNIVWEHALTNVVRSVNVYLASLVACDLIVYAEAIREIDSLSTHVDVPADNFRPPQNYGKVKLKVGTQCSGWYSARLVQHARLVSALVQRSVQRARPPLNYDRGAH